MAGAETPHRGARTGRPGRPAAAAQARPARAPDRPGAQAALTAPGTLAAHADWSAHRGKRWITLARRDGGWRVSAPGPVGAVETLLERLRATAAGAPVVLGVDLPLGLPRAYAAAHRGEPSFVDFLRGLEAADPWFAVCAALGEVGAARPFYPLRGSLGMTRASHARALGLADAAALSRAGDRATAERPAGAPLFWTLGANQTGKAALAAWRDMIIPALARADPPRLWPFEGDLLALLAPGRVVLAETYPAEAARQLGVRLVGSKQRQADRAAAGSALAHAMRLLDATPAPALGQAMAEGFGREYGEDDGFDSMLGVLCVLGVLGGHRPDGLPPALAADPWVRRWEGWVLGQTALPSGWLVDAAPPPR